MQETFLSLKNISKSFTGVRALNDVDFEIMKGEIHCLAGENGSGKSTLIKVISGILRPDAGSEIRIDGKIFHHYRSIDAINLGIEVIYQDLALFPNLSVAENISLNQLIEQKKKLVNRTMLHRIAEKAMARIGGEIPLDFPVAELSMADQQLVAICRALTSNVKLLIMDEPTTALTVKEIQALFAVIKDLRSKGIATLFISHKLNEIMEIAERITILRDGEKIGTYSAGDLSDEKLTKLMTGKTVEYTRFITQKRSGQALLEVRGLSRTGYFTDISFTLHSGEIMGITGLLGSGRTELALSLFGINTIDSGEIFIEGKSVKISSVRDAMRLGIGYVPENRLTQGLIAEQSVGNNIVITVLHTILSKLKIIDRKKKRDYITTWVEKLSIKTPSADAPVQTLSGGNQQRVVIAKWIATNPKILILDSPTVGIDVAAKQSILEIIHGLAYRGMGIIIISDEVSEVYFNCNRVAVMRNGKFLREFLTDRTTENEIQRSVTFGVKEKA